MTEETVYREPMITVTEAATALGLSYSRALELVRAHPQVVLKHGRWLLPAAGLTTLQNRDRRRGRRWPPKPEVA